MINKNLNAYVAVISTGREANVAPLTRIIGEATWYVNVGERMRYMDAGAKECFSTGTNICQARNRAMEDAHRAGLPCVQVSDDLKKVQVVSMLEDGKRWVEECTFDYAAFTIIMQLRAKSFLYGGVAVTDNRLNYTGIDFSYDKLIVNDLIVCMPGMPLFDESMALKEDYDMTLQQLTTVGGLVRANCLLCHFPHRDNAGGANTYRDPQTEDVPTQRLYKKWGNLIVPHKTRPGQVSINYAALANRQDNLLF